VRRINYRLVLPEGRLRRFRLPESFGDEVRGAKEVQPIPVMAGLGWLGVCLCSWSLATGAVDPAALFDRTWQLPADEGRMLVAGVFAGSDAQASSPAQNSRPLSGKSVRSAAPTALAQTSTHAAVYQPLPKVTFPDAHAHRGGWGASSETSLLAPTNSARETTASDVQDTARDTSSHEGARATPNASAADFNLGQMVRDMVANSPGSLPKPVSPSNDPFEADFGPASLPRLSSATAPDAPVALRPRDVPIIEQAQPRSPGADSPRGAVSGERGAVSWNGGCQRALDASVQHIGDKPPSKDASQADYTRVIGRLDVAGCGPRAHTSIEMCVAVSEGRAVGATVHTTPSTPALGECLLRKVRGLGFPASGGTDLVRTHFQVD
jgi:hypothetical protein